MSFILAIQGAASQGILWGIMALGVYITFRLLDFADLTVDGSFATGGAVCAVAIVNGINPILAVLLAIIATNPELPYDLTNQKQLSYSFEM